MFFLLNYNFYYNLNFKIIKKYIKLNNSFKKTKMLQIFFKKIY
jgi:hypothetical protein